MYRFIKLALLCSFFISCASTISFKEYAFAEVALRSAQDMKARKLDKVNYIQASSYFTKAQIAFQKKEYGQAKAFFKKAQFYAEQAELFSYLKRSLDSEGVVY